MNTKHKGDIAELKIATLLVKLGFQVLFPYGDRARYDIVAEKDNIFYRIQCKSAIIKNGCIMCRIANKTTENGLPIIKHYIDQIDFFGIYCSEIDQCYMIPIEDVNDMKGSIVYLRIIPTKNNQEANVRWAKNYEIR